MTLQQQIAPPQPQPFRFSQREFLLLDRAGAFRDYSKTELIAGEIFAVNAQYSRHSRAHSILYRALAAAFESVDGGFSAWIAISVSLSDESMPQPDMIVSRGLPDEGPVPLESMAITVEIADTSLDFDLVRKQRIYAAADVPEYWIADVSGRTIHQMWAPEAGAYRERRQIPFGARISATTVPGLTVGTGGL